MTTEADTYLARVRAALADLPPVQRDDLLEDLPGHLEETLAEVGGPLERTLGTPEAYAAELRASLPDRAQEPVVATSRRLDVWLESAVRAGARGRERLTAGVADQPYGRQLLAFLPELRPGWWVLRGYLLVAVPALVLGASGLGLLFVPRLFGSDLLGFAVALAAVVASVRLGRRSAGLSVEGRRLVVAGNVALVAVCAALVGEGGRPTLAPDDQFVYASDTSYLQGPNGGISNLYAFDADGRPLTGVQLFDQDGRPIDSLLVQAPDGSCAEQVPVRDEYGNEVHNVFPRTLRTEVFGPNGPELVRPPGIVPRRLADRPTAATPTAVLSPSPSAPPALSPSPSAAPPPSASPVPSPSR